MAGSNHDENVPSIDPYRNYRFRILWEGRSVAGVSKVDGLTPTTPVIRHRDGDIAVPPRTPAQSVYTAITLERGVTHDVEFESWANKIWDYGNSIKNLPPIHDNSLKDFRRDITLQMHNEAGHIVIAYLIHNCWVSEFTAVPSLDGGGNAVAIQRVTLENEGWDHVGPNTPTLQA